MTTKKATKKKATKKGASKKTATKKRTTKKTATRKTTTRKKKKAVAKPVSEPTVAEKIEEPHEKPDIHYQISLAKILNGIDLDSKGKQTKLVADAIKKLFPKMFKVEYGDLRETTIKLCHVLIKENFELSDDHKNVLKEKLQKAKKEVAAEEKQKEDDPYKLTIQDRIKMNAYSIATALDEALDDFLIEGMDEALKIQPLSHLNTEDCKGPQAKYIRSFYERLHEELSMSKKRGEEYSDYREAYSYLSLADRKKAIEFLESIFAACDAIEQKSKVKRKRRTTKKTKKLSTMVKNVKYKKEDQDLMVVSINPEKIIGARQLWVYNTKNRLYGYFESLAEDGLSIKGTTLQDVALDNSKFRKVRNPEALFKLLRDKKTKRGYNNAFKKLTTKDQSQSARINTNMIILAAFK